METGSLFHPLIERWFFERIGQPTPVQEQAWPRIAAGEHVLIAAPTGSGKTMAAFMWALNALITGRWARGATRVLYISPLKALNNDVQRNLLRPLKKLEETFEAAGQPFPTIHVRTRSGDTPQADRRRMLRHPPEILITTPESLNLLLSSTGGRSILTGISTVILDEIHAVAGNKRGVYLMTAVDRLVMLSGEFQRIALSATIRPMEVIAQFVGGFEKGGSSESPLYTPRPVSCVRSTSIKQYAIGVRFPKEAIDRPATESLWEPLVDSFREIIRRNRSTLLFANSRRLAERVTLKINHGSHGPLAYAHHGSLSREIRGEVERRLKAGDLKAIVATSSLELGIDIGVLDEVILVQSPPSLSSAVQRVGRAGHQVGEISRGTIFPTYSQDILEAAVLAAGIIEQDIEAVRPVESPLDVLALIIVSMVGTEIWDIDELFLRLKTSYPYRNLRRREFDLVLHMLAGRYADSRIRELKPRVSIDRLDNTVAARKGALVAFYLSGGVIPDRGYFQLRHQETGSRIGELDEEFVWEASIGQTFALGTQNWRIERITHNDVFVVPGSPKAMATPFWKAEEFGRDFHFSQRVACFLEGIDRRLDDPHLPQSLQETNHMDETSADQLIVFLKRQRAAMGCDLPHRHHIVVEHIDAGPGGSPGNQVVLHTLWGGRVNRPFAMALDAGWEARFGQRLRLHAGNDSVAILLPHETSTEELLSLVTSATVEALLRTRLEGSGFLSARFRECAGRALLLGRKKISQRMPLWMSRLRSQKLLDAVRRYDDFPILLEAWRTCLQDEFEMDHLVRVLSELEAGVITWSEVRTSSPSPMAHAVTWRQVNEYMYMGDERASDDSTRLREDLLHEVVFTPGIRPTIPHGIAEEFAKKRQRLSPGYSPSSPREVVDWVKERILLPLSEWEQLLAAMEDDHGLSLEHIVEKAGDKLVRVSMSGVSQPLIAAREYVGRILSAFPCQMDEIHVETLRKTTSLILEISKDYDESESLLWLLGEWLSFYGPVTPEFIQRSLGVEERKLLPVLQDFVDSHTLVTGALVAHGNENEVCDSENFEILLRIARAAAIPQVEPMNIARLSLFLAIHQGIAKPTTGVDALAGAMEHLLCYPMPAAQWETDILPARIRDYAPSLLDTIVNEDELRWLGFGKGRVGFCFPPDLDLLQEKPGNERSHSSDRSGSQAPDSSGGGKPPDSLASLFTDPQARYDFSSLLQKSELSPSELSDRLWEAVWRGDVTNDTFAALRRGIMNRFQVPERAQRHGTSLHRRWRSGRAGFSKWRGALPYTGTWFRLPRPTPPDDALEAHERSKDRVRLLLDRYGILFREFVARELPVFRWAGVFRSLRLMELSGEILAGCFFEGIPGPQFISHRAFRELQRALPEQVIYWLNATDPASLCGLGLHSLREELPKRLVGTHLVYRGTDLVVISERLAKALTFRVPPDDPRMTEYLGFLRHLLSRRFQPKRRLVIETINGEAASRSPYVDALRTCFDVLVDFKTIVLHKQFPPTDPS